eukprot:368615-Pelagomonas_calceolata.AAC.1
MSKQVVSGSQKRVPEVGCVQAHKMSRQVLKSVEEEDVIRLCGMSKQQASGLMCFLEDVLVSDSKQASGARNTSHLSDYAALFSFNLDAGDNAAIQEVRALTLLQSERGQHMLPAEYVSKPSKMHFWNMSNSNGKWEGDPAF